MMAVWLLAKAFIRQNRWLLLVFVLWPVVVSVFLRTSGTPSRSDLAEAVQQETYYGLAVVAFLAAAAIHNEKRSRRIATVLSKAVSRQQYLLGLFFGSLSFAGLYFAATAGAVFVTPDACRSAILAGSLILRFLIASSWTISLALLFSTFLYPFIAAGVAGVLTFAPLALTRPNGVFFPLGVLIGRTDPLALRFSSLAAAAAVGESIIFLFLAGYIFGLRDVTVAVE